VEEVEVFSIQQQLCPTALAPAASQNVQVADGSPKLINGQSAEKDVGST